MQFQVAKIYEQKLVKLLKITWPHIERYERKRIYFLIIANTLIDLLDIFSAFALSILGILFLNIETKEIESSYLIAKILKTIESFQIYQFNYKVSFLIITFLLIVLKISLTTVISKITLMKLAEISSNLSSKALENLFRNDYKYIRNKDAQEISYALNQSSQFLLIGVYGQIIIMTGEIILLIFLLFISFLVNAFTTLILISAVSLFAYWYVNRMVVEINKTSETNVKSVIEGQDLTVDAIKMWREITVADRSDFILSRFSFLRLEASTAFAKSNWLQGFPKVFLEVGGMIILILTIAPSAGFGFRDSSKVSAIIIVAIMIRILPVATRIQQSFFSIHTYLPPAIKIAEMLDDLNVNQSIQNLDEKIRTQHTKQINKIEVKNLSFKHTEKSHITVDLNELAICSGDVVSIVGPSGSGKTTLAEILLGLLKPLQGVVLYNNENLESNFGRKSIKRSYVSQNTKIIHGSVRENILFGLSSNEYNDEQLNELLKDLEMLTVIQNLPHGLDEILNTENSVLSGGELQRLGLARALINHPTLLVIDEALNALDKEMAKRISRILTSHKYAEIVVSITHNNDFLDVSSKILSIKRGKVTVK